MYQALNPLPTCFYPCAEPVDKHGKGKTKKVYDQPATPSGYAKIPTGKNHGQNFNVRFSGFQSDFCVKLHDSV
jgi:hypothetical protein